MKVIAFFALVALAANAFNMTAYHLGIDEQLGFTTAEIDQGFDCITVFRNNIGEIIQMLESGNFTNIALSLGSEIVNFKEDFHTTCKPYFANFAIYLAPYLTPDLQNGETVQQVIQQNFAQYYAQIIQQIAQWADYIQAGEDYKAGKTQSYIFQILNGVEQPVVIPAPQVNVSAVVPINYNQLFSDYFGTIFQSLGIQATINVSSLIDCTFTVQNVTETIAYTQQQYSTMDFNEKLNAIQYIISLGFYAVNSCEGAAELEGLLLVPVAQAFIQDPVTFTLEVADRIANNLPNYINSIQQEIVDIQEGDYTSAGQLKVQRIMNDFGGLVNFTTTTIAI